jgi:hypothetical protein
MLSLEAFFAFLMKVTYALEGLGTGAGQLRYFRNIYIIIIANYLSNDRKDSTKDKKIPLIFFALFVNFC